MLKAIIFDIDGVLIDSFNSNLKYFQDVFREAGYKIPTKKQYKNLFHLTVEDLIKHFIKDADKKEFKRILKIAYKLDRSAEKFKLAKNSAEIIKKLSKKYRLALVTGRVKKGVDSYLNFSKTKNYFKVKVCFEDYKRSKPHPEPLLIAAKKLKINPSEAVYVGDSLTDMQAAKAAGMKIILYSKKKLKGMNYKVASFKKLLKLVEKLGK